MNALSALLLVTLVFAASGLNADTLLVDAVKQAPPNQVDGVLRPTRGMSMARVEQTFGPPSEKSAPVGVGGAHPPITRWVYPDFSVYFERRHVLTSVVHRGN